MEKLTYSQEMKQFKQLYNLISDDYFWNDRYFCTVCGQWEAVDFWRYEEEKKNRSGKNDNKINIGRSSQNAQILRAIQG